MEFMTQAFFIRGFEEPGTEVTMNLDGGRDDRAGSGIAIAIFFG